MTYHSNLAGNFLAVNLHLEAEVMGALKRQYGHEALRINFESYFAMAANGGVRLTELAQVLDITRQAVNQAANHLISNGYLERISDPLDGRVKILILSDKGKSVLRQGGEEAFRLQCEMSEIVGEARLKRVSCSIKTLSEKLGLLVHFSQEGEYIPLSVTLPRLTNYVQEHLQTLTMAKGHPRLKRSFGVVLRHIATRAGRMAHIAKAQSVSKQAISVIASELETLGYIKRDSDVKDPRQLLLSLTPKGEQLIADSVQSGEEMEREFGQLIGKKVLAELKDVLRLISDSFQQIDSQKKAEELQEMASQMIEELGERRAKNLAEIVLDTLRGEKNDEQ